MANLDFAEVEAAMDDYVVDVQSSVRTVPATGIGLANEDTITGCLDNLLDSINSNEDSD